MSIQNFEGFYAKLEDGPEGAAVIAMQMVYKITATDGSGLVGSRTEAVDFVQLASFMADDVLMAVKAAVDAEVASRELV